MPKRGPRGGSPRPYAFLDLGLEGPLQDLPVFGDTAGTATILRWKGQVVDFWMEAAPRDQSLSRKTFTRRCADRAGRPLLRCRLEEILGRGPVPVRLPSLTVAICTKDHPDLLLRCLTSLRGLLGPPWDLSLDLEILVVDNASETGETRAVAEAFPGVRCTREGKPGLDFARNRAIREARGEILAFVDDDVVVDPGWLRGLLLAWAAHPDAAGFTGQVLPYELETPAQILFEEAGGFRRGYERIRYGPSLEGHPTYPCSAGVFGTGANMAFRRDVLMDLKGFDEALDTGRPLPAGGDHDIFYRVIRSGGCIVYEPGFLVFHQHRRDIEALRRQYWSWGLGVMALVGKAWATDPQARRPWVRLTLLWFRERLLELGRALAAKGVRPAPLVLAELLGGVQGLCGEYGRSQARVAEIRRRYP